MKKITFFLSVLLFVGCDVPKPVAMFEFVQDEDGEVRFINNSKNGDSYQWDFGDGIFKTNENPTHKFEKNGKYTVKLTTTNESEKHTSMVTINITNVEQAKYLFWTKSKRFLPIEIFIDGVMYGNISKVFKDAPDCWTSGAVTAEFPAGKYSFKARGKGGSEWNGMDLSFKKGACKSLELY